MTEQFITPEERGYSRREVAAEKYAQRLSEKGLEPQEFVGELMTTLEKKTFLDLSLFSSDGEEKMVCNKTLGVRKMVEIGFCNTRARVLNVGLASLQLGLTNALEIENVLYNNSKKNNKFLVPYLHFKPEETEEPQPTSVHFYLMNGVQVERLKKEIDRDEEGEEQEEERHNQFINLLYYGVANPE